MIVLQPHEEKKLLGAIRRRAAFGERDHAMLTLALHTGLRVSELVGLDVNHVAQLGQPRAHLEVPCDLGKGYRSRGIPLNRPAQEAIARILAFNSQRGFSTAAKAPLLVTRVHARLGVRYVQYLMECLRNQAQLGVQATPHTLRRTFATRMAKIAPDPYMLRILLGHRRLDTSIHYVQVSPEDLVAAVALLGTSAWDLSQELGAWAARQTFPGQAA